MSDLNDRIERATTSAAVVRRLESGETLAQVTQGLGLDVADLIAALARVGLEGDGPGLVQARARHPWLEPALDDRALAELFPGSTRPARLALAAGLLQILDFWDASHTAAQEADDLGESSSAAYWHLIAHRREPDPGNAQYWARRVGRHPIHPQLAEAARPLIAASGDSGLSTGIWSPTTLIDLATRPRPGSGQERLARQLQRLEMMALLEVSLGQVSVR